MFLRSTLWLSLLFSLPLAIHAQTIDPILQERLSFVLDSMRVEINNKSLGVAIQFSDNYVWADATGTSSTNPVNFVTPSHTYLTGSAGKTFTAACVLQLQDEGLLDIDDSLHQWLDTMDYIDPNITIRQLLQHTSGLYDILGNPNFNPTMVNNPNQIWSFADAISTFSLPATSSPGQSFSYCNTNYMLLAMIIEAASGQPYYQAFDERFFTPLGLNQVLIPPYEGLPDTIAHVWMDINGDMVTEDANFFFAYWNSYFSVAGPAGCYFAKPSEMAIWIRAYMGGDIISESSKTEAKTTIATNLGANTKYGLGLMERTFLGVPCFGHGGDLSYSSLVYYFPSLDISIAVMGNDTENNSWELGPVMAVLLREYQNYVLYTTETNEMANSALTCSPNPFIDHVNIEIELPNACAKGVVLLQNAAGQTVTSQTFGPLAAGQQTLQLENLGQLTKGVYFPTFVADRLTFHANPIVKE